MPYASISDPVAAANLFPVDAPSNQANAIVPSDTVDLSPYIRTIFIGASGNIKVLPAGNLDANPVTLSGLVAGTSLNLQIRRVFATGTTAALLVGFSNG